RRRGDEKPLVDLATALQSELSNPRSLHPAKTALRSELDACKSPAALKLVLDLLGPELLTNPTSVELASQAARIKKSLGLANDGKAMLMRAVQTPLRGEMEESSALRSEIYRRKVAGAQLLEIGFPFDALSCLSSALDLDTSGLPLGPDFPFFELS